MCLNATLGGPRNLISGRPGNELQGIRGKIWQLQVTPFDSVSGHRKPDIHRTESGISKC